MWRSIRIHNGRIRRLTIRLLLLRIVWVSIGLLLRIGKIYVVYASTLISDLISLQCLKLVIHMLLMSLFIFIAFATAAALPFSFSITVRRIAADSSPIARAP